MVQTRSRRLIVSVLALSLAAAACGGDGDDDTADPTTTTQAPESTTSAPADDATDDTTDDTTTTTTEATTTTTEAPAIDPIPVIDASDIPALVAAWGAGVGTPLELAQEIIGFPVPVEMPEGSSPYRIAVDMRGEDPTVDWYWEWAISATVDGEIPDIDIALDDNGPGSVELLETYNAMLNPLGWFQNGTVGSDPGDPGGPNSVNHVYDFDGETFPLGEISATPGPLRVWADEELIFGEGIAGYRADVDLEAQPNFIPVPMLEALFREVPVAPGARLIDISVDSFERPEDSFDAEYGTRYLEIEYVCELLPNSGPAAQEVYSVGLAGSVYQPGDESFFEPGFVEFEEPTVSGDTWRQNVIVLDRYPGEIEVVTDPATGAVESTVSIRLGPNRVELQPLPE
ncbi:MAG: hypothetical protein AAF548_19030 [Actinomycetota bacterium]